MKKVLSKEQQRLGEIYSSLKDHAAWVEITTRLNARIDEIEDILLGKTKIRDQEITTQIENLDTIKYSMNSLLRKELNTLLELVDYPNKIIKTLGYYKDDDATET